jgi:hypothetical protein
MFNATPSVATTPPDDEAVDQIVRAGPRGAIALAGIATAIVVLIWFAFYLFVFVPRGVAQ